MNPGKSVSKSVSKHTLSQFAIIKIIKKFSAKEISEFEKFINSPFYNNHSTVVKLFKEIKKYYPDFSDIRLTKNLLFKIVNKDEKYNDPVFQKYMSRLKILCEEYLNILAMRAEPLRKKLNVLNQLSRLEVEEVFERNLRELEKSLYDEDTIDSADFLFKHLLANLKVSRLKSLNSLRSGNDLLIESHTNLLSYFFYASCLTLDQLHLNQYSFKDTGNPGQDGIFFNKTRVLEFLSDLLKNTDSKDRKRILFLELVMNDFKLNFSEKNKAAYKNLRKLVFENSRLISSDLLLFYMRRMIAFCIIENTKGKVDMNKDLFENYKFLIDKDLFSIGGATDLRLLDFRLIVSSSLKCNENEWLEDFINNKSHLASEELRPNIFNYGNAFLLFYKKNYEGSFEHASRIRYNSPPLILDTYFLKAKIFYELDIIDSARSVADSLRHYITNNRSMADPLKTALENFLKYYKILLRFKSKAKKDSAGLKKLSEELDKSIYIRDQRWLIEKAKELFK